MHAALVFPHQLFAPDDHPALTEARHVYLVEHDRFFCDAAYHSKKLVFHRATMRAYYEELDGRRYDRHYVRSGAGSSSAALMAQLVDDGVTSVLCCDLFDHTLYSELTEAADRHGLELTFCESPYFCTPRWWVDEYVRTHKRWHLNDFYVAQRKRMEILLTEDGEPCGGSWSFDAENRDLLTDDVSVPDTYALSENQYVRQATEEIHEAFPERPGDIRPFPYPTTRTEAGRWLGDFFRRKFAHFGPYQDAIAGDEPFLFHSIISPMLNVGLLTPEAVVRRAVAYADEHDVPMQSLEGFVRQIIGWREFMAIVYERAYTQETQTNFWQHQRPLPSALYTGETGMLPVDTAIRRVLRHGYAHHIERLMILGNYMLLMEIHPDEVYRWFMELFIDAYDWVMVPNVYGMSQFADGGLFATKPYISSSNYVRKMSDYTKGEWCDVWDSLYWRFVHKHRDFFEQQPRLAMMTRHLDRMSDGDIGGHYARAETHMQQLGI